MATNEQAGGELTTKQRRAIACLLASASVLDAAKAAGIGERTLHTWLHEPAFRAALASEEARAIDTAARQLVSLAGAAVDTLKDIMTGDESHPAHKLRAAEAVLANLLKLRELAALEERVTALEAAQSGNRKAN